MSNNTHIPLHKNDKWIKAPSIYAEKTYIGVFPFTVIAESHRPIGHQPEPKECEREVSPTLIGCGVLDHYCTVCDKRVKRECVKYERQTVSMLCFYASQSCSVLKISQ